MEEEQDQKTDRVMVVFTTLDKMFMQVLDLAIL